MTCWGCVVNLANRMIDTSLRFHPRGHASSLDLIRAFELAEKGVARFDSN